MKNCFIIIVITQEAYSPKMKYKLFNYESNHNINIHRNILVAERLFSSNA
jgi:hypothetical protein